MSIRTPGGNVTPCTELLVAALGLLVYSNGARRGAAEARLAELGVPAADAIAITSRYVGISIGSDNPSWNHNDSVSPEMRGRFDDMLASVMAGTAACSLGVPLPSPIQWDKLSPCRIAALAALAEVWVLMGPTGRVDRQPIQFAFRDMFYAWYNEIQAADGLTLATSISEADQIDAIAVVLGLNGGLKRNGSYSTVDMEIQAAREAYAACPVYVAPPTVHTAYSGGSSFVLPRPGLSPLRPTPAPALVFQSVLTGPRTYAFVTLAPAPLVWSFGDGTTSTELAPVHTYAPGTYTVSLTAMVNGATQTVTSILTVASDAPPLLPAAESSGSSIGFWVAGGAVALYLLSRFR